MDIMVCCNDLILEVTRRCNMRCEHCIRGDAQNLDIGDDILEMAAKYIKPFTVTFSGGEPSLNVSAIRRYFAFAEQYGHMPSSFFVATNGKENQTELALELLNAYREMDEPEYCAVHVSEDIFHERVDKHHSILSGLAFYQKNGHTNSLSETNPKWVINAGRAERSGWGVTSPITLAETLDECVDTVKVTKDCIVVRMSDMLYVGANGLIADQCDISYAQLDEGAICHISQLPAQVMALAARKMSK